jgi:hypothetical protein
MPLHTFVLPRLLGNTPHLQDSWINAQFQAILISHALFLFENNLPSSSPLDSTALQSLYRTPRTGIGINKHIVLHLQSR